MAHSSNSRNSARCRRWRKTLTWTSPPVGLIAHDRVTMGAVLDRLLNKGVITRKICPHDLRARVLSLTAKGRTALDKAETQQLLQLMRNAADAGNQRSRAPLLFPRRPT